MMSGAVLSPPPPEPAGNPDLPLEFECQFCGQRSAVMAPITSRSVGTFALRCVLDSCNRVRVFQYLNDEVSDELTDPPPPYCTDLQSRGPVLQEVARLSVAASELTL